MNNVKNKNLMINTFSNISTLYTYLYIDENNYVDYKIDTTILRIRLTTDLIFKCKNLDFPSLSEFNFDSEMTISNMTLLINQLKHNNPIQFYYCANRWEEIENIVSEYIALNV